MVPMVGKPRVNQVPVSSPLVDRAATSGPAASGPAASGLGLGSACICGT